MLDLTLIIPAKLESESLPIFLKEIENYNCKKIVILGESDFQTINSIKDFKNILIHYQKKKGYGAAIIEGVEISDTKFFCIINADGSMNPVYLNEMIKKIKKSELDFIFASRYEKPHGGSDDDNLITLVGNYGFTMIGNIFFHLNISDILFTYVMGKTSCQFIKATSNDFTLCEMPIKAKRAGYKLHYIHMKEVELVGIKK